MRIAGYGFGVVVAVAAADCDRRRILADRRDLDCRTATSCVSLCQPWCVAVMAAYEAAGHSYGPS